MTDIGVFSQPFTAEDRSWLLSEPEDAYCPGLSLDIAKFTQATHYPNGFIPSGTALGLVTATGLYGPYDDTAVDGRQAATGILFGSIRAINPLGYALAKVGAAQVVYSAVISVSRLPFNAGNAAAGRGYIDTAGQADLKFIYFAA